MTSERALAPPDWRRTLFCFGLWHRASDPLSFYENVDCYVHENVDYNIYEDLDYIGQGKKRKLEDVHNAEREPLCLLPYNTIVPIAKKKNKSGMTLDLDTSLFGQQHMHNRNICV